MRKPTTVEWLENILRVAKTLPEEVNMNMWHDCGTPKCLWGHCCADPWFISQGLTLAQKYFWKYKGKNVDDPCSVFKITREEDGYLFDPDSYDIENIDTPEKIKKEAIIKRVEEILAKYQKEAA